MEFAGLKRITGEAIGGELLNFYESSSIGVMQCRGQCYDGAPNMQSLSEGAASYVLAKSSKAGVTLLLPYFKPVSCSIMQNTNHQQSHRNI